MAAPVRVVWKFPFDSLGAFTVSMPAGAVVRHVAMQNGRPCIWAEVDPSAPVEERRFRGAGTGTPLGRVGAYLGTFQEGPYVWHVYNESAA